MPAPKKLDRVNSRVLEVLTSATAETKEIAFAEEDFGKITNLAMQLRNAIQLFKQTAPADVPAHLKLLAPLASKMGVNLDKKKGILQIGPDSEIGFGAFIASAMQKSGLKPKTELLTSAAQVDAAHRAVAGLPAADLSAHTMPALPDSLVDASLLGLGTALREG